MSAALAAVIAERLLADHNAGYDAGTERESYQHVPLWIERKAKRLAAVLAAAGFGDLAAERERIARVETVITDWLDVKGWRAADPLSSPVGIFASEIETAVARTAPADDSQ